MSMRRTALCIWMVSLVACSEDTPEREERDARIVARVDGSVDAAIDASIDAELGPRPVPQPDASHGDAKVEADAARAEPLTFESVEKTLDDGEIVIEKVVYLSEGLRVFAQVCRPAQGAGPFPVHIINHGGFSGLGQWNGGNCADQARRGWVVAESSYRGEDGSEGKIEICQGEVSDVLRLTEVVRAQPYANPERVMMSGISHGGCITVRAVQRGAPVKMAVDIFGPTDWATAYAFWERELMKGSPASASYRLLIDAMKQATGGSPSEVPREYAARSPVTYAAELADKAVPFLRVQGGGDVLVPNEQGCALASDEFERLHVNVFGGVVTSVPTGCPSDDTWSPGPRPTTAWPKDRYLIVYDDVGHNFEGFGTAYLIADMTAFLTARFPP